MSEKTKIIVVTGASRGLGLAIAKKCAEDGYKVIGGARKITAEFEELIKQYPDTVFFNAIDLGKLETLHEWIKAIEDEHGFIYGLVNNAAIAHDGVLATMHESQIADLVNVNVTGSIILTKYAVRSMLIGRSGRIINIASIIASTGFNGLSVYGATKSALLGFTRSLARELGKAKITVNAISPGYMATEMSAGIPDDKLKSIKRRSPLNALAEVEDVAAAVTYFLSEDATRITGVDFTIDAGSTI